VVDWRTGELQPHRRELHCARMTTVGPAKMPTPLWDRFLDEITRGDQGLPGYLQRVAGYCGTGSIQEHALFFSYGEGGNGKGVFWNTVSKILGGYATVANMAVFVESPTDRHLTELAKLHGARLVTASETEGNRYWAEARIKALTGGDRIAARFMRRDEFEFDPIFKLCISGNDQPKLRNVNNAVKRRFHMIPFLFTPPNVDPLLEEKLKPEHPGILQWMITGCLEWQRIGLQPPAAVVDATAEYFAGEDLIGRWLAERCEQREEALTPTGVLFEDYREWCGENGEQAGASNWFGRKLAAKGTARGRDSDDRPGFRLALKPRELGL
jgi:putative DNA primase/helicase